MTKFQLFSLLGTNGTAWFTYRGANYILRSIERESGDGRSFNVRVYDANNVAREIFIRTID